MAPGWECPGKAGLCSLPVPEEADHSHPSCWEAVVNNRRASTCQVACGNPGGSFTLLGHSQPKEQCHDLGLILLPGCTQISFQHLWLSSGSGRSGNELWARELVWKAVLGRWSGAIRKAKASPHIADASSSQSHFGNKGEVAPKVVCTARGPGTGPLQD